MVPALLGKVGLSDRAADPYKTYSLGMKQRLGIAAALLGDAPAAEAKTYTRSGSRSSARYIVGLVRNLPVFAPIVVSSRSGASPKEPTVPPLERNSAMFLLLKSVRSRASKAESSPSR
jgi:hypothetical protein